MSSRFDSVVMLTWSNWHTEPRSNRYHYATRFAREAPVLFVQPDAGAAFEEPTGIQGITLLHAGSRYGGAQLEGVARVLARRGLTRPLVWTYNPFYEQVGQHFPGALRVFHATEDYFTGFTFLAEPEGAQRHAHRVAALYLQRRMITAVRDSDLVVCVSPGVAEGVAKNCAYRGTVRVLENGCDFAFWSAGEATAPSRRDARVAVYQGGINERLDAALLVEVMRRLPDWEFRFCGTVSASFEGWKALQAEPNFRYLGVLKDEALRAALHQADVGLMPYRQVAGLTSRLLPLKAFEYAACGLPVVTVPIDSIAHLPEVFCVARSAAEYAQAIPQEGATRSDPVRREARLAAARAQDYDRRFAELQECLRVLERARRGPSAASALRMAALFIAESWSKVRSRIALTGLL